MKLNIKERIVFGALYPEQANILKQTLVRDISKKVEITQKDMKKHQIRALEDGNLTWKDDKEITVNFTEMELNLLKERVKELDEKNKITQNILELCLKIQNETAKEEKKEKK